MSEEFHHPLKAALKTYNTDQWTVALPTILLGFRTVFKEDIQATAADLVYGKSHLPREFFVHTELDLSPQQFVEDLKLHFRDIWLTPASRQSQVSFHLPLYDRLLTCVCTT